MADKTSYHISADAPVTMKDMGDGTYGVVTPVILTTGGISIGKVDIDQTTPGTTNGVQVNAALPAGTNEIGKVGFRLINVAASALTRPANTTAYSANDSISDNSTAGSVTANSVNLSDINDAPIDLTEVLLASTDTGPGTAGIQIRIHLFNADPTASSGVGGGDNAAWSNKQNGWFGSMSGTMRAFSDGSKGRLVPDEGVDIKAFPATGATNIWWQLQTLGAFTPSANSTTFTPRFKGFQGRV